MSRIILGAIVAALVAFAAPLTPFTPALVQTVQAQPAQIDINSATVKELEKLKGIGSKRAAAIVKNRPYTGKDDLVTKKVLTQKIYDGIKDRIVAKQ